jgi:CheY-like chemotaxis protein
MWGWKNKGTFEADGDVAERDSSRMEPALDEASKAAAQQVISDRMSRSGAYSASDFVSIRGDLETVPADISSGLSSSRSGDTGHEALPWPEMMTRVGTEVAEAIQRSLQLLHHVRTNPSDPETSNRHYNEAIEQLEHAHRIAMVAKSSAQLHTQVNEARPEVIDMGEVARNALQMRLAYFKMRNIKARQSIKGSYVQADSALLHRLIDELLLWGASVSSEVALAVDTSSSSGRPRLRVYARGVFESQAGLIAPWENTGWFLWHQLTRMIGAQASIRTQQDMLTVNVKFPPVEPERLSFANDDVSQDANARSVVAGCRVLIVTPDRHLAEAVYRLLGHLGLEIRHARDHVEAALMFEDRGPHAVIYDDRMSMQACLAVRKVGQRRRAGTAFIEIAHAQGIADMQLSQSGGNSTAHVAVNALPSTLVSALVFELCKVI